MRAGFLHAGACIALFAATASACAQDFVVRGASVIDGISPHAEVKDVIVRNGRIAQVGTALDAGALAVVDGRGKVLTPALYAGIGKLGVSEISSEKATVDASYDGGDDPTPRPEFQVCDGYNPASMSVPVTRIEGYGFATIAPDTGSSFVAGSGCNVRLDGSIATPGTPLLFIDLSVSGAAKAGGSRAGSWMQLRQLLHHGADGELPLTAEGRAVIASLKQRRTLLVARIERAADIRRFVDWASSEKLRVAIEGGTEAWQVADVLKQHDIPVFVDPSTSLPGSFDMLGATLENAARLHAAGVTIAFSQTSGSPGGARRLRQFAGVAVANGLPWDAAFAAITSTPARLLDLERDLGTITPGRRADLVLWQGDPLDVIHLADAIWLDGTAVPLRSKQTELRDRYLKHHL